MMVVVVVMVIIIILIVIGNTNTCNNNNSNTSNTNNNNNGINISNTSMEPRSLGSRTAPKVQGLWASKAAAGHPFLGEARGLAGAAG